MPVFLQLDAATGCRRGELLALEWSDVDGRVLTVARSLSQTKAGLQIKSTKTEKPRRVEIDEETVAILVAHRLTQDECRAHFGDTYEGNLIFANPDGSPLRPDSVSSACSLSCRWLKLPVGVSLHTLRHSHGSQLPAAGVPITDVSKRLGLSSVATTQSIYAHVMPGRDADAAKAWRALQKSTVAKASGGE
jgi:integrase